MDSLLFKLIPTPGKEKALLAILEVCTDKIILCVIDEITNYLVTVPIYQAKSEEIGDTLTENIISKFGTPEYMIMDQDSAFMSMLMNYLFKRLGIKVKTVGPYNPNPYRLNVELNPELAS